MQGRNTDYAQVLNLSPFSSLFMMNEEHEKRGANHDIYIDKHPVLYIHELSYLRHNKERRNSQW